MAKSYEKTAEAPKKVEIPEKYQFKARKDYDSDWQIHRQYITSFDPLEAMLIGQVYDSVSNSIDGSKITDSYATTLAKERADRVIAKLPDGQTESVGRADVGKAAFMDILRQKWIYPNANSQHSFLEKLNMWQLYSSVYGYMPMFYDWNMAPSGYIGPDCWLWNPRNLIPQQGKTSIYDMEYITGLTWVSKSYLEGVLEQNGGTLEEPAQTATSDSSVTGDNKVDEGGWDNDGLKMLISIADQSTNPDATRDSKIVRERTPQNQKRGILLATRYEAGEEGHWTTFAPEHGYCQVRDLPNPHKNGRIPFVIKYSQPLFDSFYGLGDFQRAKPLQFARDGLTNFYFKGIKMNLIPPLVANANGVLKHTLDYREGAVMMETIPNSIRRLETSTAGLSTYQGAQDALTGSLLSLYGSQNASISSGNAVNPSQGKTPQAIDLYSDKEATRDGSERRHLEDSIMQLTNGFFSLVANIGTEDIPITLFQADIQNIIKSGLTDVKDLFTKKNTKVNDNGTAADLTIKPEALKGIEYRFIIDPDSTAAANKGAMLKSLEDFLGTLGKFQNILTQDPQVTVHWDTIMDTYEQLTGIPNAAQFLTFDPTQPTMQQAEAAKAQQASATSVKMPTGQVHETADLGRLYLNTNDWWVKNQILTAMGFQPAPPEVQSAIGNNPNDSGPQPTVPEPQGPGINQPGPTTISTGHTFQDPHVAAAAEAINSHMPPAPLPQPAAPAPAPAAAPVVTSSGHAFNDPTIAQAAEAINSHPAAEPAKLPAKTSKK